MSDCVVEETRKELGLDPQPVPHSNEFDKYVSLAHPPQHHQDREAKHCLIYRGLIPAKAILNRDFAINGAAVSFYVSPPSNIFSAVPLTVLHEPRLHLRSRSALDLLLLPLGSVSPHPTHSPRRIRRMFAVQRLAPETPPRHVGRDQRELQ